MKTEPSVGNFLVAAGKFVGVVKATDHEALVSEAIKSFTKAEEKMANAISQIDADIVQKEKQVAQIQGNILSASSSKDKLTRVLERFKAFTA